MTKARVGAARSTTPRRDTIAVRDPSESLKAADLRDLAADLESGGEASRDIAAVLRREADRRDLRDQRLESRFWAKVNKTPVGCWLWTGHIGADGYGRVYMGGPSHMERAHRASLFLSTGKLPDGVVMHSCDVRACVNPAHLSVGSQRDNVHDTIAKGRAVYPVGTGRKSAKLTEVTVAAVRREWAAGGTSYRELAKKYGIHQSTLWKALSGATWKHVDAPAHDGTTPAMRRQR